MNNIRRTKDAILRREAKTTCKSHKEFRDKFQRNCFRYEAFLEERSYKFLFGLYKYVPQSWRDSRIEADRDILQVAKELGYIEVTPINDDSELFINILPQGSFFAAPTNGFTAFSDRYRGTTITIISFSLLLSSWAFDFYSWLLSKFLH